MKESAPVARVDSVTEARNPRTIDIDTLPTEGILLLLNDEDARVAASVRAAIPALTEAVEAAALAFESGGTIHYFGAGTSGRICTMDAAELPPTFSVDPARVVAHHAGGDAAQALAVEAAEDNIELGRESASAVAAGDVAVGLTASGRTPFVRGALEAARDVGAKTILISSRPDGPIANDVDTHVLVDTGAEAIAGSTRLKAGTAQKLAINSFSTALMVRLGKVYSNLMVDVAPTNAKLRGRVLSILEEATGADADECRQALEDARGDTKTALVSLLAGVSPEMAAAALREGGGKVRAAIGALGSNGEKS